MVITEKKEGDLLTLVLEGRLDTTTAGSLQEALIPAFDTAKDISLDFSAIDYVSSAGLRVLLMGQKKALATGGKLSLKGVSEDVMEVLEMTGFDEMLTIIS